MDAGFDTRYTLRQRLGVGTASEVHRAFDEVLGREVAIKLFRSGTASKDVVADMLKLLSREAKIASSLQHPNIISAYAAGLSEDGRPYIVMELVDGNSLSALLSTEGALPLLKAIDIVRQLSNAVSHMHQKSLIHRDIKPSNIMICRSQDGSLLVKLIDLNLSKYLRLSQASTQTAPGSLIGTPSYMSPEQCHGLPADERSDVFAIGCVLYECLTGAQAFPSQNAVDGLWLAVEKDPPHPTQILPNLLLPAAIENIMFRALSKNPVDRYQSVAEMAVDLEQVQAALRNGTVLPSVPAPVQGSVFPKHITAGTGSLQRHRHKLVAALVIFSVAAAFGGWYFQVNQQHSGQDTEPEPVSAALYTSMTAQQCFLAAKKFPRGSGASLLPITTALSKDMFDSTLSNDEVTEIGTMLQMMLSKSGGTRELAGAFCQLATIEAGRHLPEPAYNHARLAQGLSDRLVGPNSELSVGAVAIQGRLAIESGKVSDDTLKNLVHAKQAAEGQRDRSHLLWLNLTLARAYQMRGDSAAAQRAFIECIDSPPSGDHFNHYHFVAACRYAQFLSSERKPTEAAKQIRQSMSELLELPQQLIPWAETADALELYLRLPASERKPELSDKLMAYLTNLENNVHGAQRIVALSYVARLEEQANPGKPITSLNRVDKVINEELPNISDRATQARSYLGLADQMAAAHRHSEALRFYEKVLDLINLQKTAGTDGDDIAALRATLVQRLNLNAEALKQYDRHYQEAYIKLLGRING